MSFGITAGAAYGLISGALASAGDRIHQKNPTNPPLHILAHITVGIALAVLNKYAGKEIAIGTFIGICVVGSALGIRDIQDGNFKDFDKLSTPLKVIWAAEIILYCALAGDFVRRYR